MGDNVAGFVAAYTALWSIVCLATMAYVGLVRTTPTQDVALSIVLAVTLPLFGVVSIFTATAVWAWCQSGAPGGVTPVMLMVLSVFLSVAMGMMIGLVWAAWRRQT
jgi:hypothetical protein